MAHGSTDVVQSVPTTLLYISRLYLPKTILLSVFLLFLLTNFFSVFILFQCLWLSFSFFLLSLHLSAPSLRHLPTDSSTLPPIPPCPSSPSTLPPRHLSSPCTGARLNKRRWESCIGFLFSSCSFSVFLFFCFFFVLGFFEFLICHMFFWASFSC